MRVNIDLDEEVLMKLFAKAKTLGRSRKRHMEMILEDAVKANTVFYEPLPGVFMQPPLNGAEGIARGKGVLAEIQSATRGKPTWKPENLTPKVFEQAIQEIKWNLEKPHPDSIQAQIETIQSEKIPAERNTTLGRKVWENEQAVRIEELRKQLPD